MTRISNNVKLIGFLGNDPELKSFESGRKMTTLSIATTDTFTNQNGEKVQDTQWHTLVFWGKLADIAGQYLKKGSQIAVDGKLVHRSYETSTGEKRYVTEISVTEMMMIGGKR